MGYRCDQRDGAIQEIGHFVPLDDSTGRRRPTLPPELNADGISYGPRRAPSVRVSVAEFWRDRAKRGLLKISRALLTYRGAAGCRIEAAIYEIASRFMDKTFYTFTWYCT
jgi:hypothetical protein